METCFWPLYEVENGIYDLQAKGEANRSRIG